MTWTHSWIALPATVGLVLLGAGCARDAQPPADSGRAPFQAEVPPTGADDEAREERGQIARVPTRERKLCEALARAADMTLSPTPTGIVMRVTPADGLRADALGAARELTRALHWPAEYAAERDDSDLGCGVVELGREAAIAEVREKSGEAGSDAVWFEVHIAAWPGREDQLRGRARVFVDEVE